MDTLSYKTISANDKTVSRNWYVIDAEGKVLGRVASRIASVLRGKNKTYFTPHAICGDFVIVINAEKIRLTGNKWTDKQYIRYSGYPGGQKYTTPKSLAENNPNKLIEMAVKGMLPKNRLGRAVFRDMFVYTGPEHPHQAQKPLQLKIKNID